MINRQPQAAIIALQTHDGRVSKQCVNSRWLDREVQRHAGSGAFRAVSVFRPERTPIHYLEPPCTREPRAMATTDHAETPTPAASRSLDGRQKTFTSGVGEAPPMTPPPAAGYNAPPAAPIENAKTHTYGITTDTGYGVGWDLRLPDGSIGMASAKHVTAGDTKYPPVISTPDSDFAVSRTTDGVKGGLDLASRDAEPGDQVALVTPQQGPLPATVTGSEVVTPDGGGGETFHTTTVDRPVIPGDSGSPGVLIKPGDPDHGKVVGTVSCTDQSETAMVPASTMREAVGAHHDLFTAPGQGYGRNAALDSPVGTPTEPDISATAGRLGISR